MGLVTILELTRQRSRWHWGFWLTLLAACGAYAEATGEWRALWVDALHPGYRNPDQVRQLVADARAAHFNTLLVQVRYRGDALYLSPHEPRSALVTRPDYDPLAEVIAQAHDTNLGPRLQVHAWIVTYNIWSSRTDRPSSPQHPYRLHPGWLTRSFTGAKWDGADFAFDPGHPEVQRHVFNVAMDIVTRYDVDGLHFDYVRYADPDWGYNPVAVARFRKRYPGPGLPQPLNPEWMQFRRTQVTELVRKVYLSALAERPGVVISAATIAWAPGIRRDEDWRYSAPYAIALQDWRAWLQEGILDLNVPMTYFRHHTTNAADWAAWSAFAKNHTYGRQVALGVAFHLNSLSNAVSQLRSAQVPTPQGNGAQGIAGFSYAALFNDPAQRPAVLRALTEPEAGSPETAALFPFPTNPPASFWKTDRELGHLKGFVLADPDKQGLDGATVILEGPVRRTMQSDASGFFGVGYLPPGLYRIEARHPGRQPDAATVVVEPGVVSTEVLVLRWPRGFAFNTPSPGDGAIESPSTAEAPSPYLARGIAYARAPHHRRTRLRVAIAGRHRQVRLPGTDAGRPRRQRVATRDRGTAPG